jgi:nitroimidazol reductase NimA-like FMN-containing flavoprotein (pyridoxamine 5'-phosphate oxidase superfamily)
VTRIEATRLPELMSRDRAALDELLDATVVAHVAFVDEDGLPAVLPTGIARWSDRILIHGSSGSRWMRLVSGVPAAVAITALDGVVVARSAFESSMLYRSAAIFGSFERLSGSEQTAALEILTDRLLPGRVGEVRASTRKELSGTLVLAMPIREWSLRISAGWPEDSDEDLVGDAWAGHIRFGPRPTEVIAAPDLRTGIPVPESVAAFQPRH